MLEVGTKAPEFELPDQNLIKRALSEFAGSKVVVYFYPKDDTAGCTKEACAIRDSYGEFKKAGIVVLGISADSPEDHQKFIEKYHLPFTLLSDSDKQAIKAYGAEGFPLSKRITYIVDSKGLIAKAYDNVDPSSHAAQILEDLKSL